MGYDVLTTGYVSMDRILKIQSPAQVGFTSIISNKDNSKINYGGCSINISAALCELGKNALPIIRVGTDYEEIGFKDFLVNHHVSLNGLTKIDHEYTSCSYLVEDKEGNHITLFYPGAMDKKYYGELNDNLFAGTRLAVITVGPYDDNLAFFEKCKKYRIPLVFSMKLDFDAFPRDLLWDLLCYSTIIFTNETERKAIEEIFKMDITGFFKQGNADIIVTTCGKDGSAWYRKEGETVTQGIVPAYQCKKIIDTTGSGDAYLSGFIYGYLENKKVSECAALGATLASFVLESEGCCTNLPDCSKLMTRYEKYSHSL
ncbi:carbohydrate kinase family protein [Sporolactobacillus shoreae]|uniref:Carbohydrate kinase family protein n=1 Tax=Sporolactobacillus shoreae TaxID=1465501 RepID=A0A4Z0GT94_9BACL|nr:carbohydrate kinase family protein [Sporolactobacillus shoreae]TGA99921.1 carbohydrate kinase family protein [Sporolactobacillus shoreae]